jgi:hypothetical protein
MIVIAAIAGVYVLGAVLTFCVTAPYVLFEMMPLSMAIKKSALWPIARWLP